MPGLPLEMLVSVSVTLSPTAASTRNFGTLLVLGDSTALSDNLLHKYSNPDDMIADGFTAASPEYQAATVFCSQAPQPSTFYVAKYTAPGPGVQATATAVLGASDEAVDSVTVGNGGSGYLSVPNVTFSGGGGTGAAATAIVENGVVTGITVTNGGSGYTSAPTIAIDAPPAPSVGANLATAIATLAGLSNDWYGLALAFNAPISTPDTVTVATAIQSMSPVRTMWATTQEIGALSAASTNDLVYLVNKAALSRTWVQYSSKSPYAGVSAFARIATVNYAGANTTITLKFKQEPGVPAETLTPTQYAALAAKKGNVFVGLENGDSIIMEGYMADGTWADTLVGADAYANALQVAGFNRLYSALKVPQTDAGMTTLKADYDNVSQAFVTNGLFAPGVWTGPAVGALNTGDTLNDGYYIYKPSVASQSAADRAARKAVVMQIAAKLAGAVHSSNVIVNVVN